ncbi:MAG TPA: hypothetical protein VL947_03595 [Cytophagales bacterium]|nr:hypothetical protein [Cytophagales bacterium]
MKSYIYATILLVSTGLISSCEQALKDQISNVIDRDEKDTLVKTSEYEMSVPTYMKQVTTLHHDASLQFQNVFKETYLIVIDEPKDTFITTFKDLGEYKNDSSVVKNYRDIQLGHIKENLKVINISQAKSSIINGMEAETIEVDGTVEDLKYPISYIYTFVEGPDKVYMIMAWTLKDNKDKHAAMFKKAMGSFKVFQPKGSTP